MLLYPEAILAGTMEGTTSNIRKRLIFNASPIKPPKGTRLITAMKEVIYLQRIVLHILQMGEGHVQI